MTKIKTLFLGAVLVFAIQYLAIAQDFKPGFFNKTKLGFVPGVKNAENSAFKQRGTEISTVNGWSFSSSLSIGLGLGVVAYVNPTITAIPVYADINYYILSKRSTPYLYGSAGYGFATTKNTRGGVLAGAGTGWRFSLGKKLHLGPEIGYRYQEYTYDFGSGFLKTKDNLSSASVGVILTY